MDSITLEIEGIGDEEAIQEAFRTTESGLKSESARYGRSTRLSYLGDAVLILGEVVALAKLAKTLFSLFDFPHKKDKVSIRIKTRDGRSATITASERDAIFDMLKSLDISAAKPEPSKQGSKPRKPRKSS
jgi:hypothetical protein